MNIVSGDKAFQQTVADYVLAQFDEFGHLPGQLNAAGSVAVVDDESRTVVGGIVLTDFKVFDAQLSIFLERPIPFTRRQLRDLFGYCFDQLRLKRLTCKASVKNEKSCRFLERLGFKREGTMRLGYDGRQHAAIYGMLRKDCRWIKDR